MGSRCPKALWASIHAPDTAEPLPPWAKIKYVYGDLCEALVLQLIKASGHEVTGEQDELVLDGIKGHRDCIVDGCVVDIKSCTSIGFQKYKNKTLAQDDSFGYLEQLDGYVTASQSDPLVTVKDKGYILAVDKNLGHLCLYAHYIRPEHIRRRIEESKEIVERDVPPKCTCGTRPSGKSGNIELDVVGSYNSFKWFCKPELRCFLYANGPVYLTHTVRRPDVPEVDRFGNLVY